VFIVNQFGEFLKQIRETKHMSLHELSSLSGVSTAQLSRYETGKRNAPKPPSIKKLSEALNYSYNELMIKAGYHVSEMSEGEIITPKEKELLSKLKNSPEIVDLLLDLSKDKLQSLYNLLK
jgi:transcriptional regulator with XRE-family HTH domain